MGPKWAQYVSIWAQMGPHGPKWVHMGPNGSNMGPNGPNMGPNGPNMGPIWAQYGSIWAQMGNMETNGPNMAPNGPNMGPYGPGPCHGGPCFRLVLQDPVSVYIRDDRRLTIANWRSAIDDCLWRLLLYENLNVVKSNKQKHWKQKKTNHTMYRFWINLNETKKEEEKLLKHML